MAQLGIKVKKKNGNSGWDCNCKLMQNYRCEERANGDIVVLKLDYRVNSSQWIKHWDRVFADIEFNSAQAAYDYTYQHVHPSGRCPRLEFVMR